MTSAKVATFQTDTLSKSRVLLKPVPEDIYGPGFLQLIGRCYPYIDQYRKTGDGVGKMKRVFGFISFCIVLCLLVWPAQTYAEKVMPAGLIHIKTELSYATLIERLNDAVKKNKMGLVTRASANLGAKRVLKKKIPGNMVIGVYHPRFAVRMLEASIPAGIEAPLRFYITENANNTANLSYKTPTSVFAPYGVAALTEMATELDTIFATIAREATN